MIAKRIEVNTSGGARFPLDCYVADVMDEVDPEIRRPAVVIFPGGAYLRLSEREAEPVALRFMTEGFNAFVAWYRVAPNRYPLPQQDAAAAVAWVRAQADAMHTSPNRIAVMGFSAGGHVAGSLGTLWQRGELWQEMGLTPQDVRPNAMALCYPVITGGAYAHRLSFECLTGENDAKAHEAYSVEKWVTEQCPPTFLWHTFEDQSVPVENSLLMAQALHAHGVTAELHAYAFGPHGAALANEITSGVKMTQYTIEDAAVWPGLAARFFKKVM